MKGVVLLLVSAACTGYGRRVQTSTGREQHSLVDEFQTLSMSTDHARGMPLNSLKATAELLLRSKPAGAFAHPGVGHSPMTNGRIAASSQPTVSGTQPVHMSGARAVELRRSETGYDNPMSTVKVGANIKCRVINVDTKLNKIDVDCDDAVQVEIDGTPLDELKVDDQFDGTVVGVSPFGAWVDIGAQVHGLLYYRPELGDEKLKVGEQVECRIANIDVRRQKLMLTSGDKRGKPVDEFKVGDWIEGKFLGMSRHGAHIDIGAERPALLTRSEFMDDSDMQFAVDGDMIECRILQIQLDSQHIQLSRKDPDDPGSGNPVGGYAEGAEFKGTVRGLREDGAVVDIGAMGDPFLQNADMGDLEGKLAKGDSIKCYVKSVEHGEKGLRLTCNKIKPLRDFKRGEQVEGTVTEVVRSHAFVDIGAASRAKLHATEFSEEDIADLAEQLSVGEQIKCLVAAVEPDKQFIDLTCRSDFKPVAQLTVGDKVEGRVKHVSPLAATVDIGAERLGQLQIWRFSDEAIADLTKVLAEGDKIECFISDLDPERNYVELSCKEGLTPLDKLKVGDSVEGQIRDFQRGLALVDIGAEVVGRLHITDMTSEVITDLTHLLETGESIKCSISQVDLGAKRVDLTCREPGAAIAPIDGVQVGDEVDGTVVKLVGHSAYVDIGAPELATLHIRRWSKYYIEGAFSGTNLTEGDNLKARILHVIPDKGVIQLTVLEDPDTKLKASSMKIGEEVLGKVVGAFPYVTRVDIGTKHSARLFKKDMADQSRKYTKGDHIKVRILEIEDEDLKITDNLDEIATADSSQDSQAQPEERPSQKTLLKDLKWHEEVEGTVAVVMRNGAYIDIGASKHAFLHDRECYNADFKASELREGDEIKSRIWYVDFQKQKIILTTREGRSIDEFRVGQEVEGTVEAVSFSHANIDIGHLTPARLPRVHIPGMETSDLSEELLVGDPMKCRIRLINLDTQLVYLTCTDEKRNTGSLTETFKVGETYLGIVKRVTKEKAYLDIGAKTWARLQLKS